LQNGEIDAVDRPDLADRVLEDARLDREVLHEPLDTKERVAPSRRLGRSGHSSLGTAHPTGSAVRACPCMANSSSAKWQAVE
jgi:hypothetical protein